MVDDEGISFVYFIIHKVEQSCKEKGKINNKRRRTNQIKPNQSIGKGNCPNIDST
jgi:hypothetical protein